MMQEMPAVGSTCVPDVLLREAAAAPPRRDMGLQRKLLLVSVATACVALLAAMLALFSYDLAVVRPRQGADLAGRMELLSLNLDVDLNFGDRQHATRILETLRSNADLRAVCLYDARQRLFAHDGRSGDQTCRWPDTLAVAGHRFHGDFLAMLAPVRYEHDVVGYLQVDYALPSRGERLRQYGLVLAVVLLTLVVGGLLHTLMVRRLVTGPLLALSGVAHRVTREQRYDLRTHAAGRDEVGRLAGAINDMLSTIEAREAALRRSQSLLENIVARSTAVIYITQRKWPPPTANWPSRWKTCAGRRMNWCAVKSWRRWGRWWRAWRTN